MQYTETLVYVLALYLLAAPTNHTSGLLSTEKMQKVKENICPYNFLNLKWSSLIQTLGSILSHLWKPGSLARTQDLILNGSVLTHLEEILTKNLGVAHNQGAQKLVHELRSH